SSHRFCFCRPGTGIRPIGSPSSTQTLAVVRQTRPRRKWGSSPREAEAEAAPPIPPISNPAGAGRASFLPFHRPSRPDRPRFRPLLPLTPPASSCAGRPSQSQPRSRSVRGRSPRTRAKQQQGNAATERGFQCRVRWGNSVMSNKEGEESHMNKEEKGRRKGKKSKDKGHGGDSHLSIHSGDKNHSIEMEQAEVSAEMPEKPCSEHSEGVMSQRAVKKHRKKKKKDEEFETVTQKEILDAKDNVDQTEVSAKMPEKPCSEHAEGVMSESAGKKHRKKKKKDEEVETFTQKEILDAKDNVEQTEVPAEMPGKPCSEHAEGVMSENAGKKHRKKKKKDKEVETVSQKLDANENVEQTEVLAEMSEKPCPEHAEGVMTESVVNKYRKKKKKTKEVETVSQKETLDANENVGSEHAEKNKGQMEHDKKSKKRKRKHQDAETATDGPYDQIVLGKDKTKKKECLVTLEEDNKVDMSKMEQKTESKKKRRKDGENVGVDLRHNTLAGEGKNGNKDKKMCEDKNDGEEREKENVAKRKDKGRRVRFIDDVEVFDINGGDDKEGDVSGESELVHGRRFTPEEDAKLMEAIVKYAEMKQLGEKGLEMIRDCIKHPEVRGCWAEIATSLPHRPVMAVYKRARILLYRSAERKWTHEEYEIVRRFVEKNGTNWKKLAMKLGKSEIHVKDTWRRMKPKNLRKGAWTQDEYQNLFDLVNLDLRVKAHQTSDHGHRQIRDNISWEAISEKLSTRSNKDCCLKWYQQLASPLVKEGIWADADDYLLVEALQKVDAVCVEDVDWENLLDHRSGEVCRQRWNQMVRLIGDHREKPFIEQVVVLARRYSPEMLRYRKSEACELSPDELAGGSEL
ncbi:hypothetical protein U9M48_040768, partial [Paspalum notatum var. saurae]